MHRADLQAALQAAVNDHPDIELRLGCQFEDATAHAKGLTIVQRSGMTRRQDLALALIGADGIWSAVRNHLFPQVQPRFSGLIAWRGTLEATQLPREYASRRVQLWMGPNAHLVAYPISGARQINIVVVVPGIWSRPGWSAPADGNELRAVFASPAWPAPARMMVAAVDGWRKFALFTLPDKVRWTDGAIALLGDAAHAMLPFAAQGAGMAIEDAAVLAHYMRDVDSPDEALRAYETARRVRTARAQSVSHRQGRIYGLSGPEALVRNMGMRVLGGERLRARYDWIYGWRPPDDVRSKKQ
jgi:salicylate hydroxylase